MIYRLCKENFDVYSIFSTGKHLCWSSHWSPALKEPSAPSCTKTTAPPPPPCRRRRRRRRREHTRRGSQISNIFVQKPTWRYISGGNGTSEDRTKNKYQKVYIVDTCIHNVLCGIHKYMVTVLVYAIYMYIQCTLCYIQHNASIVILVLVYAMYRLDIYKYMQLSVCIYKYITQSKRNIIPGTEPIILCILIRCLVSCAISVLA